MSLHNYLPTLLTCLADYKTSDSIEAQYVKRVIEFLRASPEPFSPANSTGHITASAVLVDETISALLMVWHEKLSRWLQPGGHCDAERDGTTEATAFRELMEESNVEPWLCELVSNRPFDIDVHVIPRHGPEPKHWHYDLRYLYRAKRSIPLSQDTARWIHVREAAEFEDISVARFARKILRCR